MRIDALHTENILVNRKSAAVKSEIPDALPLCKSLSFAQVFSVLLFFLFLPLLSVAQTDRTRQTGGKAVGLSNPMQTEKQNKGKKSGRKEAQSKLFVPRNYFYFSLKLPVEELATYLLTEESELLDYENQNGLMLDFGYGKQVNKYFTVEGGLEAYLGNSLNLLYEHEQDEGLDELRITNSAYAFQLKPIFTVPLDEEVTLRIGAALNYQFLRSAGKYYSYAYRDGEEVLASVIKNTHRSRFLLNVNPFVGADFKVSERWGLGVDLSYVRYNWDKSISGLRFSNQTDLQLPLHKTSDVFVAIKVTFR
ncbi:hypothetical protein [Pedobacter quisquiliarum]|nr:hypothetical protein [Pedobacter quisquiliarum]